MIKVIEILAESPTSWEDSTKKAVAYAGKSIRNIKSVYVAEQSCCIDDNKVSQFRVNCKISFAVE